MQTNDQPNDALTTTPIIESPAPKSPSQKANTGLKIGIIITSLLAVAGIGFGIFELLQNVDKDNKIADLKIQISTANSSTTIETPEIKTTTEEGKEITISDSVETVKTEEYLYIGKWGIKIKLGSDLALLMSRANIDKENNESLDISVIQTNHLADYRGIYVYPYGTTILRSTDSTMPYSTKTLEPIYSQDGYNYFILRQTGVGAFEEVSSELSSILSASQTQLNDILTDTTNFSSI